MEDVTVANYPKKGIITTNIIVFIWLVLGIYAIWVVTPPLAVLWGLFLALMFLFVMRKSLCTRCRYYGSLCSMGWGLYTSKLFSKRDVNEFSECFGAKFAPFLWMSVSVVPVAVIAISAILEFSLLKLVVLVLLVLIACIFGNKKSRRKACSVCRMRDICPMGIAIAGKEEE